MDIRCRYTKNTDRGAWDIVSDKEFFDTLLQKDGGLLNYGISHRLLDNSQIGIRVTPAPRGNSFYPAKTHPEGLPYALNGSEATFQETLACGRTALTKVRFLEGGGFEAVVDPTTSKRLRIHGNGRSKPDIFEQLDRIETKLDRLVKEWEGSGKPSLRAVT